MPPGRSTHGAGARPAAAAFFHSRVVEPERCLPERARVLRRAGEHRDVDRANRRCDGARDAHAGVARVPRAVDERGRGDAGERHGVARLERLERFADAGAERGRSNRRVGDAVGERGEVALESAGPHHVVRNDVGEHTGEGRLHAIPLRGHRVELADAHPVPGLVHGVGGVVPVDTGLAGRRVGRGRDGHVARLDRGEGLAKRQCDDTGVGHQRVEGRAHDMVSPCSGCAWRRTVLAPDFAVGTW